MRIDRQALHAALQSLARLARKDAVFPILETVQIDARDGEVVLTATDITTTLAITLQAETPEPFIACLPAKLFATLVKPESKRKQGTVSVISQSNNTVSIQIDGVASRLVGLTPSLFPTKPTSSPDEHLVALWPAAPVQHALGFVLPAASKDVSRPHLQGVLLEEQVVVATDGHRLHRAPLPAPVGEPLLLPASSVDLLRRLLSQTTHVALFKDADHVRAAGNNWQLHTQVVDEDFPPYLHAIPDRHQAACLGVDAEALRRAIAQVRKLAEGRGARLRVNGALGVGTSGGEQGDMEVVVPTKTNTHVGEDLLVGIDMTYLRDALPKDTPEATLSFAPGLSPLRIDLPDQRLAVIMPMRL